MRKILVFMLFLSVLMVQGQNVSTDSTNFKISRQNAFIDSTTAMLHGQNTLIDSALNKKPNAFNYKSLIKKIY